MRRSHRAVHRALWPIFAVLLGVALVLALAWRPPPDDAPQAQVGDSR